MDSEHIVQFESEIQEITKLGYTENHAGCFVCNYYDSFICGIYNGGCKHIDECEELKNKLKGE